MGEPNLPASGAADAPLVSVIIPCYQQARFLGDAIESVLGQDYPAVEVVVVDDGSPDDAAAVAARYGAARYHRQPHRGVSASRNTGLRLTAGGLVVFLDADDLLLPHALSTNVRHHLARPDVVFVSGQMRRVDTGLRPIEWPLRPHVQRDHYRQLLVDNDAIGVHSTMYRRDAIVGAGGWNETIRFAEDWELNLRLARRGPIVLHDEVIALYRRHPDSAMRELGGMLASVVSLLRRQRRHVRGDAVLEAAIDQGLRRVREWYGEELVQRARGHARAGRLGALARDCAVLLRYDGARFAQHARRKLALEARRALGRAEPGEKEPIVRRS